MSIYIFCLDFDTNGYPVIINIPIHILFLYIKKKYRYIFFSLFQWKKKVYWQGFAFSFVDIFFFSFCFLIILPDKYFKSFPIFHALILYYFIDQQILQWYSVAYSRIYFFFYIYDLDKSNNRRIFDLISKIISDK